MQRGTSDYVSYVAGSVGWLYNLIITGLTRITKEQSGGCRGVMEWGVAGTNVTIFEQDTQHTGTVVRTRKDGLFGL